MLPPSFTLAPGEGGGTLGRRAAWLPGLRVDEQGVRHFSMGELWSQLPARLRKFKEGFGPFFRSCFQQPFVRPRGEAAALWPMPAPYPDELRHSGSVDRKERQFRLFLNVAVVMLSWEAMGEPEVAPPQLRLGAPLNPEQWEAVQRLRALAKAWSCHPSVSAADMGRAALKMDNLERVLQELHGIASELRAGLDAYHSQSATPDPRHMTPGFSRDNRTRKVGELSSVSLEVARDLDASRLRFGPPPAFDPCPLFDQLTREVYLDPWRETQPESPSPPPRVRVRASRSQQLALYKLWDDNGRLRVFAARLCPATRRAGAFAVFKDADRDRLVLDARPGNLVEVPLRFWTRSLASVDAVLRWWLPPERVLAISSDDLRDYYYDFVVSKERALASSLKGNWTSAELASAGLLPARERRRPDRLWAMALNTMAMGNLNAVEFGQAAHYALGATAGALRCCNRSNSRQAPGP